MANDAGINLAQFADSVIQEADFADLEEKFKSELKDKIIREAVTRLSLLATTELADDKLKEYAELAAKSVDSGLNPELGKFIAENIPDFASKSKQTLEEYKKEFATEAKKALAES